MRVLLVRPRRLNAMTVFGAVDCEPLELEYLSAACKAMGAQPVLYDGILEHRPFSRVVREVRPDWVGLTGYLTQEREMAEYVRLARMAGPGRRGGGGAVAREYLALYLLRRMLGPERDDVIGDVVDQMHRAGAGVQHHALPVKFVLVYHSYLSKGE